MLVRVWSNWNFYWLGGKMVQLIWEGFWKLLKNLNMRLHNDSVILILVIYPREQKCISIKRLVLEYS